MSIGKDYNTAYKLALKNIESRIGGRELAARLDREK
jgi:hypothetical protein